MLYMLQMNKKDKKAKKEAKSAEQEVDEEMHNESMDMGLTARLGLSNEKKAAKKGGRKPKADGDTSKSPKKGKKKGDRGQGLPFPLSANSSVCLSLCFFFPSFVFPSVVFPLFDLFFNPSVVFPSLVFSSVVFPRNSLCLFVCFCF